MAGLLSFVSAEMPFDSPASLDEDAYIDVISYILSVNGIPAGEAPLAMGAPGVITIVEQQ